MEPSATEHLYEFYPYVYDGWEAIYKTCSEAHTSILFEHFIFLDDSVGRRFITLFKEKSAAGIKIKIILDAVGSNHVIAYPLVDELRSAGIEIEFFNTIIPGSLRYRTLWFFRDHRKLIIIDSQIAFTGGLCFQGRMREWRDTCVRLKGPVVTVMERSFHIMWARAVHKRSNKKQRERRAVLIPTAPFAYLTNEPLPRRRFLYYELLSRVKQAKHSISLTTPYFVPNQSLLRALCRAARRGVAVTLLIPSASDHRFVDIAGRSTFHELLKAGVTIYLGVSPFNHTKAGTIDGQWGTIGSLNLDYVSLRYNFEGNIVTMDPGFISKLDEQFLKDCTRAVHIDRLGWKARPFYQKCMEFCISPFSFLL